MEETHNHPSKRSRLDTQNSILTTDSGMISKVDRLSALPESLLIDILSFLRIDDATRTSALSHKWHHLWTHLPRIHIDFSEFVRSISDKYKNFHTFATTVDHIVSKLSSPKISSFSLHCPEFKSADERQQCTSYLGSWVPLICGRNPEEIFVTMQDRRGAYVLIPMCLFQCTSLVSLKLIGHLNCNVPDITDISKNIRLPNLKKLKLRYVDMNIKLIQTVVKSCPLLERLNLALELTENELVIDIVGQNLNHFSVEMLGLSTGSMFVIDAPNLISISLSGRFADYCFVSKLNALRSAYVEFWNSSFRVQEDYRSHRSKLLQAICHVGHLRLGGDIAILDPLKHVYPGVFEKFTNLTELRIHSFSAKQLSKTAPIPVSWLSRLKSMEVIDLKPDSKGYKLVKYVLKHANVLEKLLIDVSHGVDASRGDDLWSEYRFCEEVFVLPTCSESCEIKFQGQYINASSKDFDNGILHCQVNYDWLGEGDLEFFSDSDHG